MQAEQDPRAEGIPRPGRAGDVFLRQAEGGLPDVLPLAGPREAAFGKVNHHHLTDSLLEQRAGSMTERNGVERAVRLADLGVAVEGRDEIAAVAQSFNAAAQRIEALVGAHKTLLANASHELRSPLARLRLAIEMRNEVEMERSFGELDGLIDEILLASRLDHAERPTRSEPVDLLALAAEEAARSAAILDGQPATLTGDPVLLRRLLRNLLENAVRHGAPPVELDVATAPDGSIHLAVHDHGGGIAEAERARVFEPFYRPAGIGESAGSWGLGLSLVKQIAERHGGSVRCVAREGGGTSFIVSLRAV